MDLHKAALLAHQEGSTAESNQGAALHFQVTLVCDRCKTGILITEYPCLSEVPMAWHATQTLSLIKNALIY